MPEKLIAAASDGWDTVKAVLLFAAVGVFIGIGQLMASKETLTPQIIIGRAISTAGLAMASGVALIWVPELPMIGQIGLAAMLASLGTSGIERVLQRFLFGTNQNGG